MPLFVPMTGNDNDISAIDGGVLRRSSAGKDGGPVMIAGRQGRGRGTRWMQEHAVLLTPLIHSMVLMSAGRLDECLGSIIYVGFFYYLLYCHINLLIFFLLYFVGMSNCSSFPGKQTNAARPVAAVLLLIFTLASHAGQLTAQSDD